jgi:hypothetical protein
MALKWFKLTQQKKEALRKMWKSDTVWKFLWPLSKSVLRFASKQGLWLTPTMFCQNQIFTFVYLNFVFLLKETFAQFDRQFYWLIHHLTHNM